MDNIISKRMKESLEMIQKMREADFTGCLQAAAQSLLQTYRKGWPVTGEVQPMPSIWRQSLSHVFLEKEKGCPLKR